MTVDQYIKKQKSPNKEILGKLRLIIKKTVPGIKEEMKLGVPWYEGKFYLVGLKNHVNMGFAHSSMIKKYQALLGGKGSQMRHVKFFKKNDIQEKELVKLIKATKKGYKPAPSKKK